MEPMDLYFLVGAVCGVSFSLGYLFGLSPRNREHARAAMRHCALIILAMYLIWPVAILFCAICATGYMSRALGGAYE